jgi:hypothetical protein
LQVKLIIYNTMRYALVIIAVLLAAGCSSTTRPIYEYDYREGTEGLVIDFVENTPPEEVYELSDFLIGVDVANKGAHDIEDGIFVLSLEDDYVEVRDWKGSIMQGRQPGSKKAYFDIEGKSPYLPDGGLDRMTVRAQTKVLDIQTETRTTHILFTTCYQYKTIMVEEVCVDPDTLNRNLEKPCEVEALSPDSQGGPVVVTQVDVEMLESIDTDAVMPQFTLTLDNVGDGEVFDAGSVELACSSDPMAREDVRYISVSATLTGQGLECRPQPVHLRKGTGKVRCTLEGGYGRGTPTFIAPLVVELDYGYAKTISQEMVIRRVQ